MNLSESMYDLLTTDQEERAENISPQPFLRFWRGGGKLSLWAPCGQHWDLKFSDKDLEHGTLQVTVPGNELWDEYFEGLPEYEARLVSADLPGGARSAFIITDVDEVDAKEGSHAWQVNAASVTKYLEGTRLWSDPLFPPELQISQKYRGVGPAATVIKTAWALNLIRLQSEAWSIPVTNPFDPGTWNLAAKALDPIIVNPRRMGLFDTSGWILAEWEMDDAFTAAVEVAQAQDLSIRADLWLPGDAQPFPEWLTLTEPRLVVDLVPTGRDVTFTGTMVDGAIREVIKLADDAFDWITYPLMDPAGGIEDELQKRRGPLPIPTYRAGEWSPLDSATKTISYPTATRSTVGGKSPDWLNTLISDGAAAAIAVIGAKLGYPGLSAGFLTDGMKNRVMSYHSVEDRALAAEAGRWRLRESFAGSQTTALSLQAAEAAKSDLWAHRGRVSRQVEVMNGSPYLYGIHLRVGHPVAVENPDGTCEVQTLSAMDFDESRGSSSLKLTLSTPEPEEPGLYALTKIREAAGWMNRLALSK